MKTIVSLSLLTFLAAVIILPLQERQASAQAPAGQQGGAPPQQAAPKSPTTPQQQAPQAGVSIAVEVPVVTLDVIATTQRGDILTGLKKENFKLTDEGVAQTITNFGPTDAPITMVLLLEFSSRGWGGFFASYAKYWSQYLFPQLKQQDWVALVTFDMKTRVDVDFTQNKEEVMEGIRHLY